VPPAFLLAIAQHETGMGTAGWGKPENGSYVLGYGAYSENNADSTYAGVDNQMNYAARQIAGWFNGRPYTADNIRQFARESWGAADPNWANGIISIYGGG